VDAEDDRASVSTNPSHRSSFLINIVNELLVLVLGSLPLFLVPASLASHFGWRTAAVVSLCAYSSNIFVYRFQGQISKQ